MQYAHARDALGLDWLIVGGALYVRITYLRSDAMLANQILTDTENLLRSEGRFSSETAASKACTDIADVQMPTLTRINISSESVHSAERIPERFYPGKFDIYGNSHQIFHVACLLAALAHYVAICHAHDYHHYVSPSSCSLYRDLLQKWS